MFTRAEHFAATLPDVALLLVNGVMHPPKQVSSITPISQNVTRDSRG
jgi:hypothetical protein